MPTQFISQPYSEFRLGDYLRQHFEQDKWTHFHAAIAFVKKSGTQHISQMLKVFSQRASVKMSIGIDLGGTSKEGLTELLECIEDRGEVKICHNENSSTFHPKIYIFKNDSEADLLIGSGNLTEGGLYTNYEASIALSLNLSLAEDKLLLDGIENTINYWANLDEGTALLLTSDVLEQLVNNGDIPVEERTREIEEPNTREIQITGRIARTPLFARKTVPPAPVRSHRPRTESYIVVEEDILPIDRVSESEAEYTILHSPTVTPIVTASPTTIQNRGFLMTLQRTDVGVGQTNPGTSRRSPEIFIPLVARDYNIHFWGWPNLFVPDIAWQGPVDGYGRGKMDRSNVRMRLGTSIISVNMFYNPNKRDLRLRSEALRSAGDIEDILRIERVDDSRGVEYYVEIVPKGTTQYAHYLSLCVNSVRNSQKKWGYY